METDTTTCPECSGTSMVDTARGLTCDTCGLVIDEGQTFVVQEQLGKNGAIHAHEILHGNTTTIIGTKRERMTNAARNLHYSSDASCPMTRPSDRAPITFCAARRTA